ncbi:isoleucyl-tRNA synthetase [Kineosphaera limosa]|uniref:Isoleucine--tRNA ligase n=1 Tax=Kineosphaera limosa NBRC 100340 TaxID=1184609 RepID=K6XDH2_9MICO|nr:isoleucine--tRNA ligase [Kineosphaera limosa]NYE02770.1 isoleucyl-tRNA synthetase [Kineosphaera limosa]GAB96849.1 isoleucine--tRNA ligase [Kineosphaera limosa NBRC 100340]
MIYPKVSAPSSNADAQQSNGVPGAAFGVPASPRFPQIERDVLAYWEADDTFRASVQARPAGENGDNEFVFYDGPPFANGLPHYGHLLTGYVKDVVPRYQTMRGKRVERRFGWDTHGLPAELEAMAQLGIKTKEEILDLGIEAFNAKCRESVLKYTDEWQDYVTRQARWVDFENDYKTLNVEFMESVLWAFKSLYDKGLVYEGFRVLPYCWNDQTPLSNHELRMDDEVYQVRQDPAVTVGLRILPEEGLTDDPLAGALALIWTTTPWTLPSNLAIMVGEDIEYVLVESDVTGNTERYLLAEPRLAAYARELGENPKEIARYTGAQLAGRRYLPPFDYYVGWENAHRFVVAEFVTTTDGSGLVHTAGAFGEDDKVVTDREGIEAVMPVGPDGRFTAPVAEYEGMLVFDANAPIIDHLKAATRNQAPGAEQHDQGSITEGTVLLRRETYDHSYPHCWRCREPLIYKGVSSWFVEVTKFKNDMLRTNEDITWVPEHVKYGQFGKWLENARDWSISRNRFWGSPIPVWRSDNAEYPRIDVYGSLAQLEADFGELPRDRDGNVDLHRPFVDELTRPNPDDPTGQSTMRRVEDVLDVWFDSGSMSYAQVHYPFEKADWFEHHFPADFIVEYIGQTRGWFYTMHILATALFDRPAFESCISHGIVLGNDGQKMSKSLRNYPDVTEVFDRDGADAMRWFLMQSPILRGGNLVVTEQGIREGVRQALLPLWSTWYFFTLYANAADGGHGVEAKWSTASQDVLDRYLLAKLRELVDDVTAAMDGYDIAGACDLIRAFLDVLTNWYVRRSRDRFWDTSDASNESVSYAFDTLYTTLEVLCRVAAPLLPLTTEQIWRGLTGGRSVHLTDWPVAQDLPADHELVLAMDRARAVCSVGSSLRKAKNLRVRLPLARLTVVAPDAAGLADFSAIIADELNVKDVALVELTDAAQAEFGVSQRLSVNARAAGPRLGRDVQVAIKGAKSGDWSVDGDGQVVAGGLTLVEGEYTLETVVDAALPGAGEQATAMLPMSSGGGFVVLDTCVTPELATEGLARDIVRAVQQARKEADLDVSDRIGLTILGDDDVYRACLTHERLIMTETLAVQFGAAADLAALPAEQGSSAVVGDGRDIRVVVTKR